jgi:NAD+ diphosphatase
MRGLAHARWSTGTGSTATVGLRRRQPAGGRWLHPRLHSGQRGHRSFPRLDLAIIVLAHRDQHCPLGRQPTWPADRFSTIAGFVEPGEALEDAVRREVAEETNIVVSHCEYRASQPWPFPASLMIGFHAMAASDDIRLNDGELAEARWFRRGPGRRRGASSRPRLSADRGLVRRYPPGLAHCTGTVFPAGNQPPEQR